MGPQVTAKRVRGRPDRKLSKRIVVGLSRAQAGPGLEECECQGIPFPAVKKALEAGRTANNVLDIALSVDRDTVQRNILFTANRAGLTPKALDEPIELLARPLTPLSLDRRVQGTKVRARSQFLTQNGESLWSQILGLVRGQMAKYVVRQATIVFAQRLQVH
jgi:hypothetical protein